MFNNEVSRSISNTKHKALAINAKFEDAQPIPAAKRDIYFIYLKFSRHIYI